MKRKKLLFCAICLLMSANMTACGNGANSSPEMSVSESQEPAVNYEEISKNIVINGTNISWPTTVNELGADYSIGEALDIGVGNYKDYDLIWYELKYKNKEFGQIMLMDNKEAKNLEEIYIGGIGFTNKGGTIDGLGVGDKVTKIEKKWGVGKYIDLEPPLQDQYKYNDYCNHIFVYSDSENHKKIGEIIFEYLECF